MAKKLGLSRETFQKFIVAFIILFIVVLDFKFLAGAFKNLRPIADDYCNATAADMSIFSNFNYWFNLWSGDIFQIVISYLFVGLPTLQLPLGIGSAVPLTLSILGLSSVIYFTLVSGSRTSSKKLRKFLLFISIFGVTVASWITFWYLPIFYADDSSGARSLAEQYLTTILSWQTVNGPYVLQLSISLLLVLILSDIKFKKFGYLIHVVIGFLVGTSGYVLAASLLLLVFLETLFKLDSIDLEMFKKFGQRIIFGFSVLLGMYISANSPGALNRKSYLPQNPDLGQIFSVVTDSSRDWIDLVISASSIYAVLIGILITSIKLVLLPRFSSTFSQINTARFIFLSLTSFIISRISEIFSYPVFWHSIFSSTFLFLALVCLGAVIADNYSQQNIRIYQPLSAVILGVLLVITTYGLSQSSIRLDDRRAQWDLGPAPAANGQPADRELDWISNCWLDLQKMQQN